jgi:hypothetical protein
MDISSNNIVIIENIWGIGFWNCCRFHSTFPLIIFTGGKMFDGDELHF